MTAMLRAERHAVNRKRVQRLMRKMGIAALGPKPRTTRPAPGHKIFPYLLRDLAIERPNQVWCADITYPDQPRLPLSRGDHGLGEPGGAGVAAVEHDGHLVLRLGARGGARLLRHPGDLQHRPGQPVHQRRLQRHAGGSRHSHLDGRPRPLDGQRVHRAAVALAQARGHLPQRLRRRPRGLCRHVEARCEMVEGGNAVERGGTRGHRLAELRMRAAWIAFYNRASQHPSVHVVEEKRLC